MIPAEFDYAAPESLDEAIKALADGGEDAKLLAGGHSLIPLMKLRLAAPSLLVDLRKVPGLHGVQRENGHWRIGALTPHAELERHARARARGSRGRRRSPTRRCATAARSAARWPTAIPASDLPAVLLLCEGDGDRSRARRRSGRSRAADLFQDYLETAVGRDEVLTEVRVPALDG